MKRIKKNTVSLLFLSTTLILTMSTYAVSCVDKLFGNDISNVSNYNWIKEEPYFKGYESISTIKAPFENVVNIESNKILSNSYFDLSTKSTSFKTKLEIEKQAATGVPLNSKFLPNGNYVSDFKKVKRANFYNETNRLVDWNHLNDLDAKYNKSKIKLQDTEKTMLAWTKYQDPKTKELNMSTIMESTSLSNSNIGNKRTYERSFNNYQYNDILVSWAGAIDEGIIVPPAKNQIEKAHLNGTKILGNIFLDGYHGLTKQNLKGFLDKDDKGKYKVTSVLIEMALYLGFDGWFWNNEPNGAQPNSTVIDTKITTEIMNQLQNDIRSSNNPEVRKLEVYGYKNYGRLSSKKDQRVDLEAEDIYKNTNYFIQDFWNFSDGLQNYFDENNISEEERYKVFNMYNAGAWIDSKIWLDKNKIGKRDLRDLNYIPLDKNGNQFSKRSDMIKAYQAQPDENGKLETITFKEKDDISTNDKIKGSKNSISFFAAHVAYDIASQEMDELARNNKNKNVDLDVYGMVAANNYDDMIYTGANKALSNLDKGIAAYPHSWTNQWSQNYEGKSYGIGNLVQEKTVLIDNNDYFKTNFSTGQGKKFVSPNGTNSFSIIEDYPWSNTNIADVQPTYKWDLTKNSIEDIVINANSNNPISGFYDYNNVYLKGNSISLGSGYNTKGEIQDSVWDANSEYTWNIMGSNYKKSDQKNISVVLKVPAEFEKNNTVIHIIDNNGKKNVLNTSLKELKYDNDEKYKWVQLTANTNLQVAKIGVTIFTNNQEEKFLISCGELKVWKNKNNEIEQVNLNNDSSITIESLIKRDNKTTLRFSLNDSNYDENDKYSYYEIYYKNRENKLVRLTENITNSFYIKDLSNNIKNIYIKKIPNDCNYNNITWFQFEI